MTRKMPINGNVFVKVFIAFFIIIIVFLGISLYINTIGMKKVQNEILALLRTELSYTLSSTENEIRNTLKVESVFLADESLNKLSGRYNTLSDYESIEIIKDIYRRVNIMGNVSTFIDKVSIHIFDIGKTITSNKVYSDINNAEASALKSWNSLNGNPLLYWNDKLYLSVKYPTLESDNKTILYMVTVEISKKALYEKLDALVKVNGGLFILKDADNKWEISNSGGTSYYKDLYEYTKNINVNDVLAMSDDKKVDRIKISDQYFWVIASKSSYLNTIATVYIPEKNVFQPMESFRIIILILALFTMFALAIFGVWLYRVITKPLNVLMDAFRQVEGGDIEYSINGHHNDEFYFIFIGFNNMIKKVRLLITQLREEKTKSQNAEIKQLQYRMNPHLLYNSLYCINRMARIMDFENIILFTKHLGDYYRFINKNATGNILLSEECKHAMDYLQIQKIRFQNRIKIEFEPIPDKFLNLQVPALIIQPVIENAILHGLTDKIDGIIKITNREESGYLHIITEDNGAGFTSENINEITKTFFIETDDSDLKTLAVINKRLKLQFGSESGVKISCTEKCNTRITLVMRIGDYEKYDGQSVDC